MVETLKTEERTGDASLKHSNKADRAQKIVQFLGVETEVMGLIAKDFMRKFWHNGATMFCSSDFFGTPQEKVSGAKQIETTIK